MSELAGVAKAGPCRFKPYPEYRALEIGTVREIPSHWRVRRLRFAAHIEAGQSPPSELVTAGAAGLSFLQGNAEFGTTHPMPRLVCDLAPKRSKAGDLLLSVRAPVGALNIADQAYGIGRGLCAISPGPDFHMKFCYYLLWSIRSSLDAASTGSTYEAVTASDVGNMLAFLPPVHEQCGIASFLDRETAKIDALVAKKERLIELLQEKRAALITGAITKGLDSTVPMKASGLEWFGAMPAHWTVLHLRRVITTFVDYRGKTPEKTPSGVPLVTARNIKQQRIDFSASEEFIADDLYERWMVRGFPEPGDVLVTTEAPLGEAAQIDDANIALAQRLILLKANKARVTNDYLKYHFVADSGRAELWSKATGSTALGIKASHLKATLIPVPPIEEQSEIARHLDLETAKIDALLGRALDAIERLKELRTALISAAVTGKIDVRERAT